MTNRLIKATHSGLKRARITASSLLIGSAALILLIGLLGACQLAFPDHAVTLWTVQVIFLIVLLGLILKLRKTQQNAAVNPLGHIRQWASEIREGNFSARVPTAGESGFVELADDINRLAEWLDSLANDAEIQLRQQAERLASKSQTLQLLSEASSLINDAPNDEELVRQFLESLRTVLDAKMARAYIKTGKEMRLVGTIDSRPELDSPVVSEPGSSENSRDAELEKMIVPLEFKDKQLGRFELFLSADSDLKSSEIVTQLPAIGRHLGMAIEKFRLEDEAIRMSAMEERARVASELHDSLAQTLAALKLQARVLDESLAQGEESAIWTQMEQLEKSIEEATQELRDLIAQFRKPAGAPGKRAKINHVINQFRRKSDIELVFDDRWQGLELTAEYEQQVARVIQEALANAQKHSNASTIRVLLRYESALEVEVVIEDDGVGFNRPTTSSHPGEHVGLSIMQERADLIDARLTIDSEPGEGTRVSLILQLPAMENVAGSRVANA